MKKSLTRIERLKKREDLNKLFSPDARSIQIPGTRLAYCENGLSFSRFAVCTTRKIGKAVIRNRNKRIVREIYRTELKDRIKKGLDIAVVLFSGEDDYSKRKKQLTALFEKGQIFD